jgi:hypothetical protein
MERINFTFIEAQNGKLYKKPWYILTNDLRKIISEAGFNLVKLKLANCGDEIILRDCGSMWLEAINSRSVLESTPGVATRWRVSVTTGGSSVVLRDLKLTALREAVADIEIIANLNRYT